MSLFLNNYPMHLRKWLPAFRMVLVLSFLLTACTPSTQVAQNAISKVEKTLTPVPRTPPPSSSATSTPLPAPALPVNPTQAFTATPDNDPGYFYGGLIVSLDNVGKVVQLRKKESFLLDLGQEYSWVVTTDPPGIVSQNLKITPDPNNQGVYIARKEGETQLQAVGNPICRSAQPACSRPTVLYKTTILVVP